MIITTRRTGHPGNQAIQPLASFGSVYFDEISAYTTGGPGRCRLAELTDNVFDDFNESIVFIILEAARVTMSILAVRRHRLRPELDAFTLLRPRALCWRCCCQPNCSAVL